DDRFIETVIRNRYLFWGNSEGETASHISWNCSGLWAAASLLLAGCAVSSGLPAAAIPEPEIARAYIPLKGGSFLIQGDAAALAIAPGIAVTNGHNRNLVDPKAVIGEDRDYDLLFFRSGRTAVAGASQPRIGEAVQAFGQGKDGDLRRAQGVVDAIAEGPNATVPAYFTFIGNAGPGFSGGPVLDASGQLVGITFGYKNEGKKRLIYAYPMDRVRAELAAILKVSK
ncbi:MAG: S1 family peptidase, partial [Rhizomicrobium sp.]